MYQATGAKDQHTTRHQHRDEDHQQHDHDDGHQNRQNGRNHCAATREQVRYGDGRHDQSSIHTMTAATITYGLLLRIMGCDTRQNGQLP